MCAHFATLLFTTRGGRTGVLNSECKIDESDFTDWKSYLPSNLMEKISPNPEASTQILEVFHQHGIVENTNDLDIDALT